MPSSKQRLELAPWAQGKSSKSLFKGVGDPSGGPTYAPDRAGRSTRQSPGYTQRNQASLDVGLNAELRFNFIQKQKNQFILS